MLKRVKNVLAHFVLNRTLTFFNRTYPQPLPPKAVGDDMNLDHFDSSLENLAVHILDSDDVDADSSAGDK